MICKSVKIYNLLEEEWIAVQITFVNDENTFDFRVNNQSSIIVGPFYKHQWDFTKYRFIERIQIRTENDMILYITKESFLGNRAEIKVHPDYTIENVLFQD